MRNRSCECDLKMVSKVCFFVPNEAIAFVRPESMTVLLSIVFMSGALHCDCGFIYSAAVMNLNVNVHQHRYGQLKSAVVYGMKLCN
jgi:hypothetical protein